MRRISIGCAAAALLATLPTAWTATALSAVPPAPSSRAAVVQAAYHHHVRHHRRVLEQQPDRQDTRQVPTGGGDYGAPDSAFPEGENSPVRPGGSYAVTAPIGSPAYAIQKEQQDRLCRDNPEVC